MKIFISWSGKRSHAVAVVMSSWLKCVIQALKPWISSKDIERGALWFQEINNQLQDTEIGIICITQENKNSPWLLFEAGALAKGLTSSRVCTLLIDLSPKDIEDPLAQFNHTLPTRENFYRLIETINAHLETNFLDTQTLSNSFDTYWEKFISDFKQAIENNIDSESKEDRTNESVLEEILDHSRYLSSKISLIESKINITEPQSEESSRTHKHLSLEAVLDAALNEVALNNIFENTEYKKVRDLIRRNRAEGDAEVT